MTIDIQYTCIISTVFEVLPSTGTHLIFIITRIRNLFDNNFPMEYKPKCKHRTRTMIVRHHSTSMLSVRCDVL